IAVFVGISHNDYQGLQSTAFDHYGIAPHTATGSAHSIAANRISYCLNLRGPSIAMDTACSSALTAIHTACEHIWAGRGDTALAGGVTVMITPGGFIGFSQASMLSPYGRCAAFDATANGFVRGEEAGMVLLKRLSQAIADGDPVQACEVAEALCEQRSTPLAVGSVKTKVGHLEPAAGIAGLLKAMLVLQHREIPGSLHFSSPSPHIDFDKLELRVPTDTGPFPETDGERLAGVNSFGFGGANAHVILTEPPSIPHADQAEIWIERAWPVMLSARSEDALRGYAMKLASWLTERV